jgi:hypothetical protein
MRRRAYLAACLGVAGSVAGCAAEEGEPPADSPTDSATATDTPTDTPPPTESATQAAAEDDKYPVPESELKRGALKDAIPAIVDPVFADDWSGLEVQVNSQMGGSDTIEPRLGDADEVIGVVREGEARAYPLRVLNWHEVVNDSFGGPLLVTYCPLCRTGVTAVRTVEGQETTFGVSGLLWKSNLVMYDELTDSRWSQVAATAIRGEQAGTRLELLPSTITSWNEWRETHPDTQVLVPPPESSTVRGDDNVRNYNRNPYLGYADADAVGLGRQDYDDRLHPKTRVVGVADSGAARAYPRDAVEEAELVNDRVGDLPVVVTTDPSRSLVAYSRVVDGEPLEFAPADTATMTGGGSTWRRSTGTATDGPHEGTTLERANDRSPMFWFSWADVFPDTDIYGQ